MTIVIKPEWTVKNHGDFSIGDEIVLGGLSDVLEYRPAAMGEMQMLDRDGTVVAVANADSVLEDIDREDTLLAWANQPLREYIRTFFSVTRDFLDKYLPTEDLSASLMNEMEQEFGLDEIESHIKEHNS